jgi:hypothetical protein
MSLVLAAHLHRRNGNQFFFMKSAGTIQDGSTETNWLEFASDLEVVPLQNSILQARDDIGCFGIVKSCFNALSPFHERGIGFNSLEVSKMFYCEKEQKIVLAGGKNLATGQS